MFLRYVDWVKIVTNIHSYTLVLAVIWLLFILIRVFSKLLYSNFISFIFDIMYPLHSCLIWKTWHHYVWFLSFATISKSTLLNNHLEPTSGRWIHLEDGNSMYSCPNCVYYQFYTSHIDKWILFSLGISNHRYLVSKLCLHWALHYSNGFGGYWWGRGEVISILI